MKSRHIPALLFAAVAFAAAVSWGADYYVSQGGTPRVPYDAWTNSARFIHQAVAQAGSGDTVWVSNGTYLGYSMDLGGTANVVVVTNGVRLQSVNGWAETRIEGGGSNRAVYAEGTNTLVSGFWIANGRAEDGGGVWCGDHAVISNCVVISNAAEIGGGVFLRGGILEDSLVYTNLAESGGGGVYCDDDDDGFGGRIYGCDITLNTGANSYGPGGGGVYGRGVQLEKTYIRYNQARQISTDGGSVMLTGSNSWMRTCLVESNRAGRSGGGLYALLNPTVENCTFILNHADEGNGGGMAIQNGAVIRNCIIWYNTCDRSTTNIYSFNSPAPVYEHCCIPEPTNGTGLVQAAPQFEDVYDGGYNLLATSPCMDAGTNQPWMAGAVDLSGYPRIYNQVVDIGVDENAILATRIERYSGFASIWTAPREGVFRLQWTTNPVAGNSWQDWAVKTSTGRTVTFLDTNLAERILFYRLIWDKQP